MNGPLSWEIISHIRDVYRRVVPSFIEWRNVVACGIGFKILGSQLTDIPSLVVSVEQKRPLSELATDEIIPEHVDDIPTDVIETGPIIALGLNRRSALRPARPGMSIGHQRGNIGTFGALVTRGEELFILGNNHVLALLNKASPGDPILQPAAGDGGTADDVIGTLAEFVPIKFVTEAASGSVTGQEAKGCASQISSLLGSVLGGLQQANRLAAGDPPGGASATNLVDAATARVNEPSLVSPNIIDINGPPRGITTPILGSSVIKSGRTTGLTEGMILQVDVTVNVQYGSGAARFENQIMATPFSQPGDSGSLVLDYERQAVGLLFSGSDQITVINPIDEVLSSLNIELIMG